MKILVRAARAASGGPFLWLTMVVIFGINTAVLFATYWDRDIVDYVLAVLNPMLLIPSGFITGVKTYDWLKERHA